MSARPRERAPWRSVSLFTSRPWPPRCLIGKRRTTAAPNSTKPSSSMPITISSAFDAGNIRVVAGRRAAPTWRSSQDHMSDFYQWFYFRVAGAAGREVTLRIMNCAGSAYPHGWPDYKGVMTPRPRGLAPHRGHELRQWRADDEADAAAGRGLDRLFRALFDGAAPRSGHPDRGASRTSIIARSARASTGRTSTA